MSEEGPFFCITLREGGKWAVEAEWPDGSIDLAAQSVIISRPRTG